MYFGPPAFGWGRGRHCGHGASLSLKLLLPRCQALRRPGVHRQCCAYDSPAAKLPVGSSFLPAPPRSQFLTSFSAVLQSSSRSRSLKRQQAMGLSAKDNARNSYLGRPFPTTFQKSQELRDQQPKPGTRCPPSGGLDRLVFPKRDSHWPRSPPLGDCIGVQNEGGRQNPLKDP